MAFAFKIYSIRGPFLPVLSYSHASKSATAAHVGSGLGQAAFSRCFEVVNLHDQPRICKVTSIGSLQ